MLYEVITGLVQEHHHRRHADLASEQDVLTGLGHRAVSGRANQDRTVHLRSTGDHVLDVVGVTRAVDVSVVTALGLVLDVSGGDGDTALALFRSIVNLVKCLDLTRTGLLGQSYNFV